MDEHLALQLLYDHTRGAGQLFLASVLIEVGTDHLLADPEPLAKMVDACGGRIE